MIIFLIKNNSNNDNSNKIRSPRTGFRREPLSCTAGLLITTAANIFLVDRRRGLAAEEQAHRQTWHLLKYIYICTNNSSFEIPLNVYETMRAEFIKNNRNGEEEDDARTIEIETSERWMKGGDERVEKVPGARF